MKRNKKNVKVYIIMAAAAMVLLFTAVVFRAKPGRAESARNKVVKSVFVEYNDTLWSIAEEYYTEECGDMKDYTKEIKAANHMASDTLHAGNYIIVPYYQ